MTLAEREAEAAILRIKSADTQKFAVPLLGVMEQSQQDALERLMLRDWIRLIDISALPTVGLGLYRVFRVMPEAEFWLLEWEKGRGT